MSEDRIESGLDLTGLPELPAGWCWVKLSTVARIDGGITKDQNRQRTVTMREVPYLRVANVQRGYLDLQEIKSILADDSEIESLRLERGDVLFTEGGDRDKLGRGWVWQEELEECIHQNHIFRARLIPGIAEPKFISFHGNFFGQKWFTRTGKQTTNLASINKGVLSRFPVPLAPFKEQTRIVEKLEELLSDLDAGVAALKRAKANLKRYRAAVLKAAVEGKLTEEWRAKHPANEPASTLLARILKERRQKWEADQLARFAAAKKEPPRNWREKYVEPTPPDTAGLPSIPDSWTWATLDAIADLVGGITKDQKKANQAGMRDVPYLRVANVQRGFLDLSEIKSISASEDEISELRLKPGDVLFTEGGDRDKLGRGWVWTGELNECIHQNHIFRARLLSQDMQPRFASHHGNTFGKEWFIKAGKQTTNLASINLGILRRFPVPVPPATEQAEIIALVDEELSQIDATETAIEHGMLRASRLRQSILRQAFEGRLIPQDPTDEPASVLLDRLRSSRSAHEGNGKAGSSIRPTGRVPFTRFTYHSAANSLLRTSAKRNIWTILRQAPSGIQSSWLGSGRSLPRCRSPMKCGSIARSRRTNDFGLHARSNRYSTSKSSAPSCDSVSGKRRRLLMLHPGRNVLAKRRTKSFASRSLCPVLSFIDNRFVHVLVLMA
jgi:type I restriction enzyme, S subunit